ncbi:MAG: sigma 54-interacting transcriptional regulator, partial [Gemmatimonadales bacterium]
MAGERLLILEDDALLRSILAERFTRDGLDVATAGTLAEARTQLNLATPDVGLIDLRLPDGEGLSLLKDPAARDTAWVVMTAHATVSLAVEALKLGAKDFLEKPFSLERAVATVKQALETTALRREVTAMRANSLVAGASVIGESQAMQSVFGLMRRLAEADATTVLIEGESGTGKGVIAQALHRMSKRAQGPFLNVTISALPETLMESELFGHEKGAFTDARTTKRGLVEMADHGTLFLDEIAELTPGVQAKLLRFIEERAFRRLGGTKDMTVDVRIVAATNRSLADEVTAGRFRPDLFYRLRVVPITMPPLRERPDDIMPLAKHFLEHFNREFGKRARELTPEAVQMLMAYDWPGNVRELRNVIERAVLLADGDRIGPAELPLEVSRPEPASVAASGKLEDVERRLLVQALEANDDNQSRAAKTLGISRHQIRTLMRRHGLLPLILLAMLGASRPTPARAQTAADQRASAQCLMCHADREVMARRAPPGVSPESLLVGRAGLTGTAHAGVPCVRCHPLPGLLPHPVQARATVPCGTCHAEADSLWRAGPHGGRRGAREAAGTACHGRHDVLPARALRSAEGLAVLTARCVTCHKDRAFPVGDVHRGKVSCAACHGSHMVQPVHDPATHGVPIGIAQRCAACHQAEATLAFADVHGTAARAQASGLKALHGDTAATCIACHGGHGMKPARDIDREVGLIQRCATCHPLEGASYADTYHGRATRLGYYRAARCVDCHGSHHILPSRDPASPTSVGRRVATCARCHASAAGPSFISYRAHVRPHDPSDSLPVFGAWLFMNVLLFSVFTVFGVHTVLWLARLLTIRWHERRRRRAAGLPPLPRRVALDSSDRGGPYVWRFKLFHRLVHGISVVSFFALVITGLPLRFSCTLWAADMMRLLGGTHTAGLVHRTAGAITIAYFLAHVVYVTAILLRSNNKRAMLWGPDSLVFQPQDVRDFVQMFKWFFGKAPFPRFGRYGYNEKFHYFGAFWGILLLGGTGLVRWLPGVFTRILPGWAFNVAAVIHSEEAMLAAGFMFLIHFFNVHLRPDKFPLDA